jgi:hypothetical protein
MRAPSSVLEEVVKEPTTRDPVLVMAPILLSPGTRHVGWVLTRSDAVTLQQREYLRRLRALKGTQ